MNGWRMIGTLNDGMGSLMIPAEDFREKGRDDITPEERVRAKKLREEKEKKARTLAIANREVTKNLKLEDRDQIFREVLKGKTLFKKHRELLKKRGLTDDQITDGMFRSLQDYSGESDSIAVPVWHDGLIIGYQIRMDSPNEDGKRYFWHTDGEPTANHLRNGELPIAKIGKFDGEVINLCESTGFKPYIAQRRFGKLWVGQSGGHPYPLQLEKVFTDTGAKKAVLWADAGSRINKQVKGAYFRLHGYLEEFGSELLIADWGQWDDKSQPDCDEITSQTEVTFKPATEFFGEMMLTPNKPEKASAEEKSQPLLNDLELLIDLNLPKSAINARLGALATKHDYYSGEVRKIYDDLLSEADQVDSREQTLAEVNKLVKAQTDSLDLYTILPPELACEIYNIAELQSTRPEAFLTILLGTLSGLNRPQTMLKIHQNWDDISPNFFGAIVADPSQLKTPTLKAITGPLKVLEMKARDTQKEMMLKYRDDIARYESLAPKERREFFPEGKPQEPRRRMIQVGNATMEGLRNQFAAHPDRGLIWRADELAGVLKSFNAYRQGKGSDNEELLQAYDGDFTPTLRATGIVADIDRIALGIVGTIQPKVLEELVGSDDDDSSGKWSRFAMCLQPLSAIERFPEPGEGAELAYQLTKIYERLDSFPAQQYTLTPNAYELFRKRNIELEQLRKKDPRPVMRVTWGKTRGRIGKVAVLLHQLAAAAEDGAFPTKEIPDYTVKAAIAVADFYAGQIEALYSSMGGGEGLASHLSKVIDLSKAKGWIKASDVTHSMRRACKNVATAKGWFQELAAIGKGELRGEGRKLEFRYAEKSDQVCDPKVIAPITFTPLTGSGFQEDNNQKVINVINSSSTSTEPLPEDPLGCVLEPPTPPQNNIYLGDDHFDHFDHFCSQDPLGAGITRNSPLCQDDHKPDHDSPNASKTSTLDPHFGYYTFSYADGGASRTILEIESIDSEDQGWVHVTYKNWSGKKCYFVKDACEMSSLLWATQEMEKLVERFYELHAKIFEKTGEVLEDPTDLSYENIQKCIKDLENRLGVTDIPGDKLPSLPL
ncbi:YfjI family protein [Laspinema sp. D1]|uniref:YfjI family protein n=1 Tax=Laspinema palackyanum D2a TaxID=2953684 RepID=A0ABT2MZC9_9CYAN|nr:YfjI family protein [Laspinema sp. D2a]